MPNPRKKNPLITVNKVRRINKIVIKHYKHICLLNHRLLLMIKKKQNQLFVCFNLRVQCCVQAFYGATKWSDVITQQLTGMFLDFVSDSAYSANARINIRNK